MGEVGCRSLLHLCDVVLPFRALRLQIVDLHPNFSSLASREPTRSRSESTAASASSFPWKATPSSAYALSARVVRLATTWRCSSDVRACSRLSVASSARASSASPTRATGELLQARSRCPGRMSCCRWQTSALAESRRDRPQVKNNPMSHVD